MERNTLSTWGWIIVTTIIIAILIAAAVPFGKAITIGIKNSVDQAFGQGHECVAGAEATCSTPQVCTKCHKELAPALGHSPGPAATCTEDQVCTVCGAVITPAHGHNYTGGSCPDCGETAPCTHESLIYTPIEPTGYYNEVHTVSCQDCSYTTTEECSFNGMCTQHNDYSHFRMCDCGGAISDAAHNLVDGVCEACGYGALCAHSNVRYDYHNTPSFTHEVICEDCSKVVVQQEACDIAIGKPICSKCGYECTHPSFVSGACTMCGHKCTHSDSNNDGVCDNCGDVACTHETWEYYGMGQHECTKCGTTEYCDYNSCVCKCGKVYNEHVWEYYGAGQHKCTNCDTLEYCDPSSGVCKCGYVYCTHENVTYTMISPSGYYHTEHNITCRDCSYTGTESCSFNGEYSQHGLYSHFKMCDCGGYIIDEDHDFEEVSYKNMVCSKCEFACSHDFRTEDYYEPGEYNTGYQSWRCTICEYFYDEILPPTGNPDSGGSGSGSSCSGGHTPGPAANCTTAQTCTVCGTVLAERTGRHSFDAEGFCTVCGTSNMHSCGAHDFDGDGYCDYCGAYHG